MQDLIEINLGKLAFDGRQRFFWRNASLFYEWCERSLGACVEKLETTLQREFAPGNVPQQLLSLARSELSNRLHGGLCWEGHFDVVRTVLKNPADLAAWMTCPMDKLAKLPKRLRDAVADGERKRAKENHAAFFSDVGETEMANYLSVWQSRDLAQCILIALARREITVDELDGNKNATGTISIGRLRLSEKRWVLRRVETSGNLGGRGVAENIFRRAQHDDRAFFIELGRVLQKGSQCNNLKPEVEWNCVNEVAQFVAHNWCSWPGNCDLPPLCIFENKALATFCGIALGKAAGDRETSEKALRKWISRLRLKRAKKPRIGEVKVTASGILFS